MANFSSNDNGVLHHFNYYMAWNTKAAGFQSVFNAED